MQARGQLFITLLNLLTKLMFSILLKLLIDLACHRGRHQAHTADEELSEHGTTCRSTYATCSPPSRI